MQSCMDITFHKSSLSAQGHAREMQGEMGAWKHQWHVHRLLFAGILRLRPAGQRRCPMLCMGNMACPALQTVLGIT